MVWIPRIMEPKNKPLSALAKSIRETSAVQYSDAEAEQAAERLISFFKTLIDIDENAKKVAKAGD